MNVHASLLPRWRGASPIAAAIRAGDAESGVGIMEMALAMDAGPVVAQATEAILPTDTTGTLEARLAELGARLLIEVLPGWLAGERRAVPQDPALVTLCGLVAKADGYLSASMTVGEAERVVRAANPWPGASVEYRGERLLLWKAHPEPASTELTPGCLTVVAKAPALSLVGGLLVLDEVQRPGGKRLTGQQFLVGERGQLAPTAGLV